MPSALVYVHGFLSSPQSFKAQQFDAYLARKRPDIRYIVPSFSNLPSEAKQSLDAEISALKKQYNVGLVGSSLGGFYANYLAESFDLKAVVVNPAVQPYDLADRYSDIIENPYTQQRFRADEQFIADLKAMERKPTPSRYLLLSQTGDETLDYRNGVSWYAGCEQIVEQGGDHAFQGFDRHLAKILQFLDL